MGACVAVISTLETKAVESHYLAQRLEAYGLLVRHIDVSLKAGERLADAKLDAMTKAVEAGTDECLALHGEGCLVFVGVGGGTGSELIVRLMRALPPTYPKILATTLPFDPRAALADSSVIIVPTLADVAGLNPLMRDTFETVAAMTAGLCARQIAPVAANSKRSVALTALGATDAAVAQLLPKLEAAGYDVTVFHSNGYGGSAYARFVTDGMFDAVIDMTPHELTRMMLGGAHVAMPTRFSAGIAAGLSPIVLPGALNFVGLGAPDTIPDIYLNRPHYRHSSHFTHVQVTPGEMESLAMALIANLNDAQSATLIIPMGGFSHQDAPGGAIEAPELRHVFRDVVMRAANPSVTIIETDAHIGDTETALCTLKALARHVELRKETKNA